MTNLFYKQEFFVDCLTPPRNFKSMLLSCGNKGLQPLVMPDASELNGELLKFLGYTPIYFEVTS